MSGGSSWLGSVNAVLQSDHFSLKFDNICTAFRNLDRGTAFHGNGSISDLDSLLRSDFDGVEGNSGEWFLRNANDGTCNTGSRSYQVVHGNVVVVGCGAGDRLGRIRLRDIGIVSGKEKRSFYISHRQLL